MKKLLTKPVFHAALAAAAVGGVLAWTAPSAKLEASSHREAPLIADDPLADNTDLYAFRSPGAATNNADASVTIIANYIPLEIPQGGPIYNTFGENIRYEIHVKNDAATPTFDDIIYRFTFTKTNEDPTTFFRARLLKENQKTTYRLDVLRNGTITNLVTDGVVPAPNIGPKSINTAVGLNKTTGYTAYMESTIRTLGNGIRVYCGPTDDPFFTDLGAIFDLGSVRPRAAARDGLARKNTHAIAMQIPVSLLVKAGTPALTTATSILSSDFIIGVWASASRQAIRTINANGTQTQSGDFVQVSRLGMPLTNEVVIPIGQKDEWNSGSPFGVALPAAGSQQFRFDENLMNPELGLYMAEGTANGQTYFGAAIEGLKPLRIQSRSRAGAAGLPADGFDFRNGANGLAGLAGSDAVAGTALAPIAQGGFGEYLLRPGKPRSVDLLPIFHTGVPNLRPYQLATGKGGNPLAAGKPFINNFLPTFGDMLRLNMAVPPTPRTLANGQPNPEFSSEGLLAAAVTGLTVAPFNTRTDIEFIPNMDGFPNGRRLEDDVTRIELQAVGGVVLAAIGLWYDDFTPTTASPVTPQLGNVLGFTTNIEANDTTFRVGFPYSQTPWSGTNAQRLGLATQRGSAGLGMQPSVASLQVFPNPVADETTFSLNVGLNSNLTIVISDITGKRVATVANGKNFSKGTHNLKWRPGREVAPGQYIATVYSGRTVVQSVHIQRD